MAETKLQDLDSSCPVTMVAIREIHSTSAPLSFRCTTDQRAEDQARE